MDTVMDRSVLDAFADGALPPEESARVVMHLADCPTDAAYVDAVMEIGELLAAAYAAPLHEPVPERLRAAVFPGATISRPAAHASRRPVQRRARTLLGGALAAGVGLMIGLAALPVWRAGADRAAAAEATLRAALESRPSGPVSDAASDIQVTLIGTFFDREGRPCREYESLDRTAAALTQGVACHAGSRGWTTEVAVTNRIEGPETRGDAYVPAEGAVSEALDDTLDRLGAGMALTPSQEQTLIAGDWRR